MKVTIDVKCDRCKREAPQEVDSADIPKLEAAEEASQKQLDLILDFFEQQTKENGTAMPDLVVCYKGQVQTIGKVCDAFCDKTVKNQIAAMFKEMDVSKRKPKDPAKAKDTAKDKKDAKDAKGGKAKKAGSEVQDKAAGTPAS
jgi:hypothetical protein